MNSNGHRDQEVTRKKPHNVFRILALGDSFTVGANVAEEEAYPQVLESLLQEGGAFDTEVINAGVGGWEPFQYAQYFEYYGYQFEPNCILVGFFVGNDTYDQSANVSQLKTAAMGRRVSPLEASRWLIKLKIFAYQHSHLARLMLTRGYAAKSYIRNDCQDFTQGYLEIQRARLVNHLKRDDTRLQMVQNSISQLLRIKQLADGVSVPLVVILIPDENQLNPSLQKRLISDDELNIYDFEMPQSMLKEIFGQHGIPVIDLLVLFREDQRCLYMNDTHWTPEGHQLAAKFIYKRLKEMGLPPANLKSH